MLPDDVDFSVPGNPLEDISSTERIVEVFFHGESVNRGNLIEKK